MYHIEKGDYVNKYQRYENNPKAYFVFPQLYHIEKGDSYIEPANITGQLIINDLTIRVTGVTENKYLIVRQGRGKPEAHIKKDGVYTFKDNNLYFGFGVSVIGECNITITQLPTSILKDFSGNKHDAYLYGFI